MLTPKFQINQDDVSVTIVVHAPYTKVSEVDIFIEETCFAFHAKPYYLRLELPGTIVEAGSSCKYEVDKGAYTVHVCKQEKGEHFENLDLLTTMLAQKKTPQTKPLIEVVEEDVNCEHEASLTKENICSTTFGYGFANQKHGVISKLQEDLCDIVYIRNPDDTSLEDRKSLKQAAEDLKFDSDYYLADLYEDDYIQHIIKFIPEWKQSPEEQLEFTDEEKEQLQKLPNKEYLISENEQQIILNGLFDILFAYAYNVRVTEGEGCVESAWNIRTISHTLSWCCSSSCLKETVVSCLRRSLCYPQYRNWKLGCKVVQDVIRILKKGRRYILHCLLHIWRIFQTADGSPCYILNDLYITDYCVWLQKLKTCDELMKSLSKEAKGLNVLKKDLDLELELIEEAAELVLADEKQAEESNSEVDELTNQIGLVSVDS
uniref:protein SHQ1 homolog isoform X1 n=1 Tax=Ciona intestinalis TaxID=7719 RepID=UPI000180B43A|nr:protein SHQ1 homolog isoform X1 [Ciona intestinalis]XP_018669350.1 protein SHQ1 homolog isoform X1 [Ciona intestinalis]|eukprot:XP_002127366.1 protein SHQ1 homolog isoform X1 [Ciona intestinalis]